MNVIAIGKLLSTLKNPGVFVLSEYTFKIEKYYLGHSILLVSTKHNKEKEHWGQS